MRLAVDFHDTLTAHPRFFKELMADWPWRKFIITGTPRSQREYVERALSELGFEDGRHYDEILMGFEYRKAQMTPSHFIRMRDHKLGQLLDKGVAIYFDDNPIYAEHIRNQGITVFQVVHSDGYLKEFAERDPYFTANLQEGMYDYLKDLL